MSFRKYTHGGLSRYSLLALIATVTLSTGGCDSSSESTRDEARSAVGSRMKVAVEAARAGRYPQAEQEYHAALKYVKAAEYDLDVRVRIMQNLARVLAVQGKTDAAKEIYKQVLSLVERVKNAERSGDAHVEALASLAELALARGDLADADSLYHRILELAERGEASLAPHNSALSTIWSGLARVERNRGNIERADSLSKRGIGMRFFAQGFDQYIHGKLDEAETMYRRALSIQRKTMGALHPDVAHTNAALAILLASRGNHESALAFYKSAARAYGRDTKFVFELGVTLENLAASLRHTRDRAGADSVATRSQHVLDSFGRNG